MKVFDRSAECHLSEAIFTRGYYVVRDFFDRETCQKTLDYYTQKPLFRSRVLMSRHGFGEGEYQYFGEAMPEFLHRVREHLYRKLLSTANAMMNSLGYPLSYPTDYSNFLDRCAQHHQHLNTVLMLKYGPGDYNRLHQDEYGDIWFPLQCMVLLNHPGEDFCGGEFVLTETEYMKQSRARVVPVKRGDMVIFAVRERPARGRRGIKRCKLKHGVSEVMRGERHALGIIFHQAK